LKRSNACSHRLADVVGRTGPHVDDLAVTLVAGDETPVVLLLDLSTSPSDAARIASFSTGMTAS
jgi:hypothetical protein